MNLLPPLVQVEQVQDGRESDALSIAESLVRIVQRFDPDGAQSRVLQMFECQNCTDLRHVLEEKLEKVCVGRSKSQGHSSEEQEFSDSDFSLSDEEDFSGSEFSDAGFSDDGPSQQQHETPNEAEFSDDAHSDKSVMQDGEFSDDEQIGENAMENGEFSDDDAVTFKKPVDAAVAEADDLANNDWHDSIEADDFSDDNDSLRLNIDVT